MLQNLVNKLTFPVNTSDWEDATPREKRIAELLLWTQGQHEADVDGHITTITKGFLQGGLISPQMYNMVGESINRDLSRQLNKNGVEHEVLLFADDTTLFLKKSSKRLSETVIDIFENILRNHGLKINRTKT